MNFIELVAQQGSLPFRCVGIAQRLITIQVRNGENSAHALQLLAMSHGQLR